MGLPLLRQAIQLDGEVQGFRLSYWKPLQLCSVKFKPLICRVCVRLTTIAFMFTSADLLHPKARRGAIEQAEQGEMIVLGGIAGQLDNRGRTVEDLAAAVEHEVVVGGDEGKGDG
jgi:hypothetical protein